MFGLLVIFAKSYDYQTTELLNQVQYYEFNMNLGDSWFIKLSGNTLISFKENYQSFLTKHTKNDGSTSSTNTKSTYWVNDGESLKIEYSSSFYSSGSSGSIKVGIVRIPPGCIKIFHDFNPTTKIFSNTTVNGLTEIITKDSQICFAFITNNEMKYDILYSTRLQHTLYVYGPSYNIVKEELYTPSTIFTYSTSYISKPLVFYLKSNGESTSRLISISISSIAPPSPTRSPSPSISRSPIPQPTPQPTENLNLRKIYEMNEQVKYFEYGLNTGEGIEISLPGDYIFKFKENYQSFLTTVTSHSYSGNSRDSFWIKSNEKVIIQYGPYNSNNGVSGSLKFGIVRIPQGCITIYSSFSPTTWTFSDTGSSGVTTVINKDSQICFSYITNDEMEYDVTYSTPNNHNLYVYGPSFNELSYIFFTSSTYLTSEEKIISKPIVFYLNSDGVTSSRLVSVKISHVSTPGPTPVPSRSPYPPETPEITENYIWPNTIPPNITTNLDKGSSSTPIIIAGGAGACGVVGVGAIFFRRSQQVAASSASESSSEET